MRSFHYFLTIVLALAFWYVGQDLYRIYYAKKHSLKGVFLSKNIAITSGEKQKNLLILAANQYQMAASWCPKDPVNWAELGKLYWLLAQKETKEKSLLYQKAKIALLKTKTTIPLWGEPCYYLGEIYLQQQKIKQANYTMATTHLLASHNSKMTFLLANYWWQRVQKNPDPYNFALMADRFYTLNKIHMEKYSISTLVMWQQVTQKDPWGNIFRKTEENAFALAQFYFKRKKWNSTLKFLEKIKKKLLLPKKHFLVGNVFLAKGKLKKASKAYQKAISLSSKQMQMLKKICKQLIIKSYIEEAFELLQPNYSNSISMHNFLLKKSLEYMDAFELAPFFADVKEKFPRGNGELYFLLSQFHKKMDDIHQAIFFAEKAIEEDYTKESYAKNFCTLLFANKMEQKVTYYLKKHAPFLANPTKFYLWIANVYRSYGKIKEYKVWKKKASMEH